MISTVEATIATVARWRRGEIWGFPSTAALARFYSMWVVKIFTNVHQAYANCTAMPIAQLCQLHGYAKAAASTRGITSAAAPCRLQCAWASNGVTFGFTCTTVAPAASARCGSSAAG